MNLPTLKSAVLACLLVALLVYSHTQQHFVYNIEPIPARKAKTTNRESASSIQMELKEPILRSQQEPDRVGSSFVISRAFPVSQETKEKPEKGKETIHTNVDAVRIKYYAMPRNDRSGMQLKHFLKADAYAFDKGGLLGGVCNSWGFDKLSEEKKKDRHEYTRDTTSCLEALGLNDTFRYECPSDEETANGAAQILHRRDLKPKAHDWNSHFSPEWLHSLRARVNLLDPPMKDEGGLLRIAVHVRRGDVDPCSKWKFRYLPNIFYLNALDTYLPIFCGEHVAEKCKITIFSQNESMESFDPFVERGYELNLDGRIEDVWLSFVAADVLFASQSSFSWAPALFSRGQVIYPRIPKDNQTFFQFPGWHPFPEDSSLLNEVESQTLELAAQFCKSG